MKIKRISAISGVERTKDIPVDPADWLKYQNGYEGIEDAMPYLTFEDRQFILSGIIPSEWVNVDKFISIESD